VILKPVPLMHHQPHQIPRHKTPHKPLHPILTIPIKQFLAQRRHLGYLGPRPAWLELANLVVRRDNRAGIIGQDSGIGERGIEDPFGESGLFFCVGLGGVEG